MSIDRAFGKSECSALDVKFVFFVGFKVIFFFKQETAYEVIW